MLTIPDFHGQNAPKEELEKVEILPIQSTAKTSGTILVTDGLSSFEKMTISLGIGSNPQSFDSSPIDKSALISVANGAVLATQSVVIGGTTYTYELRKVDNNTLEVINSIASAGVYSIIGEKKRYATKNLSRTISVNLGNNIAVNSRYEVDLPSEFYESDGSIKKGVSVRAEVYYDGSTGGFAGWGATSWTALREGGTGTDISARGVVAHILEDKVVVQTGQNFLLGADASQYGTPFGDITSSKGSLPCQVIATLNDAYILSVEPAQGSFERIVNAGLDVLEFTNNGDYAYVPLSDADFDGDIFEYNSTTRFLRPKKSGKHIPSVFSHAEDGAGQARVKYVLVQADTAQGDNPVVATGVFTKQYTSDGGTQSIHTPINLDESKWYALYAENFTSGNVTYTSLVSPTSEPDLGDITDYAFIFSLERG